MRTHVDFFSGLGSWAIAAANNGLKTIALCEREEWLAKGLEKIWQVPCYRDINDFPSQDYANRVWILTGSPPCQPASRAGKQGGAGDVRWLWPQTIRHTEIIKPAWFCYENPPGIADVGLDGIITDLARIGYEVQLLRIPACAVDSPQDRDRFWILGHSLAKPQRGQPGEEREQWTKNGHGEPVENGAMASGEVRGQPVCGSTQGECGLGLQQPESELLADCESDARRPRLCEGEPGGGQLGQPSNRAWQDYQWIACPDRDGAVKVRRAPTGLYELAHGVSSRIPRKFHSKMIAALGNAIVWQVADQIIKAIMANA